MARTKQTARMSTGGKAPVIQLQAAAAAREQTIADLKAGAAIDPVPGPALSATLPIDHKARFDQCLGDLKEIQYDLGMLETSKDEGDEHYASRRREIVGRLAQIRQVLDEYKERVGQLDFWKTADVDATHAQARLDATSVDRKRGRSRSPRPSSKNDPEPRRSRSRSY